MTNIFLCSVYLNQMHANSQNKGELARRELEIYHIPLTDAVSSLVYALLKNQPSLGNTAQNLLSLTETEVVWNSTCS